MDAGARAGEGGRADRAFVFNWDRVRAALVGQLVKNPPAVREALVPFLGWEDPLEKGKATRSRILAWRIPGTEEPGGLQSRGPQGVGPDFHSLLSLTSAEEGARFRRWMVVSVTQQCERA